MAKKHAATLTFLGIAFLLISSGIANAYAVPNGTPGAPIEPPSAADFNKSWTNTWNSLSAPFQNFAHSLGSINGGSMNVIMNPPAPIVVPEYVSMGAQNVFRQFDTWLYGIVGFHISTLVTVVITVLEFVLVIARRVIDFLLSLIHLS